MVFERIKLILQLAAFDGCTLKKKFLNMLGQRIFDSKGQGWPFNGLSA
jgi:hypothetical protein